VTAPRLLVIQNADSDPVGRLGDWLSAAGLDLDVHRPYDGEALPSELSAYAGLLVLGGGMGASDDARAPWLPQVRALLRDAVSGELPTLGVCLGGQLLAVANGGQVAPNPDGPEFGAQLIAKRAASANDPLFGPLPITPDVIQWHFDAINSLPPGALQLASSPGCAVQAFRLGRLAWGIQFHIETTPEIVRGWAATDARALEGYDVQRLLSHADGVHDDLAEVWAPFATSFADVVRDPAAVRASRAVPTIDRRADHRPGRDPGGARRGADRIARRNGSAVAGPAAAGT